MTPLSSSKASFKSCIRRRSRAFIFRRTVFPCRPFCFPPMPLPPPPWLVLAEPGLKGNVHKFHVLCNYLPLPCHSPALAIGLILIAGVRQMAGRAGLRKEASNADRSQRRSPSRDTLRRWTGAGLNQVVVVCQLAAAEGGWPGGGMQIEGIHGTLLENLRKTKSD